MVKLITRILGVLDMDKGTLCWIFSTIAQVAGALIATLGVFTVYVLEWLQKSIEWSRNDMVQAMKKVSSNLEYDSLNHQLDFVKKRLLKIEKNKYFLNDKSFSDEFIRIVRVIYDRRVQREFFSNDFNWLIFFLMGVLVFSILGLFLLKYIVLIGIFLFIICFVGILLLICIIVWIKDLLNRNTMEEKREQQTNIDKVFLKFLRRCSRHKKKSLNEEKKEEFDNISVVKEFLEQKNK